MRLAAIGTGAVLTGLVFYRNHRKLSYKRTLGDVLREFSIHSLRSRWQLTVTFGVSTAVFLGGLFHIPRTMWIGIAAMSVLLPFRADLKKRVHGRIPGNMIGAVVFLAICVFLPPSVFPYIGVIGGIGVGLSASYQWQAVFNSLGAMAIATSLLGLPGAILFRIVNNFLGAAYGQVFEKISSRFLDRITPDVYKRQAYICLEDNKPLAADNLKKILDEMTASKLIGSEENLEIRVLPTKYPQGGERQLIQDVYKRQVKKGSFIVTSFTFL